MCGRGFRKSELVSRKVQGENKLRQSLKPALICWGPTRSDMRSGSGIDGPANHKLKQLEQRFWSGCGVRQGLQVRVRPVYIGTDSIRLYVKRNTEVIEGRM